MQKRYRVAEGREFTYPADPVSLRIIQDAGGVSQLSDAERAKVKFKTVAAGDDCSDMPKSSRDVYVGRGWVVEEVAPVKADKAHAKVVPVEELPKHLKEAIQDKGGDA